MSSNSKQTATKRNNPSHLFASGNRNTSRGMTSSSIADDIAAFKKSGGRIEVLGNTPFRARVPGASFRSKANTQRKTRAPASKTAVKN